MLGLKEKIAQMLICGIAGTGADESARALVDKTRVGGIILYGKNTSGTAQTIGLTNSLQSLAKSGGIPLIISIDAEHGRVYRIKEGTTRFADMAAVGRIGDTAVAKKIAEITSEELLACGINMNFAPVCDVNINPYNEVIGDRSFSPDPASAAEMVRAYIEGGLSRGMILCAKHFPGHGDTRVDSHKDLPVVSKTDDQISACELVPFRAAIDAGVQTVMTAHILFPRIDILPATMSRRIITDMLTYRLGFGGVIISDDMEMGAISKNYGVLEAFTHSINAGVNMFIISGMQKHGIDVGMLIDGLANAVSDGAIDEGRIDASVRKILDLKKKYIKNTHNDPRESLNILRRRESLEFAESLIGAKRKA